MIMLSLFQQPATTTDLKAKIKTLRNHKKFSVEYDRFKDVTDIEIGDFYIKNQRSRTHLETSFRLSFKGQEPPASVRQIYFFFTGPSVRVYDNAFAIIDGQRFEIAEVDQLSTGVLSRRPSAMLTMQWDLFLKLANSQSAELQIGNAELKFEDEHLQAFRDLIALLRPTTR
jgi:hypothetical protein